MSSHASQEKLSDPEPPVPPKKFKARLLEQVLSEIAATMGLRHDALCHGWVQVLRKPATGQVRYIMGYDWPLNDCTSMLIAKDKAATSSVLTLHQIPNVQHTLLISPQAPYAEYISKEGTMPTLMRMLRRSGPDGIVLKPKDGSSGLSNYHVQTQLGLEKAWADLVLRNYDFVVCPFRRILAEYRFVMLDGAVRLSYEKVRPQDIGDGKRSVQEMHDKYFATCSDNKLRSVLSPSAASRVPAAGEVVVLDWQHNLCRGALANKMIDEIWRPRLEKLAKEAMGALNLRFASVDIIRTAAAAASPDAAASGERLCVLEVNAGVMMENYMKQHPTDMPLCKAIYTSAATKLFSTPSLLPKAESQEAEVRRSAVDGWLQ